MREKDQRTQLTRSLIRQAFTGLLQQKPLQHITVKELCQKAGINRSTFYAHYVDIYDLLAKVEEDMLEDFQRALAPLLGSHPRACPRCKSPRGFTAACRKTPTCAPSPWESLGTRILPLRLLNIGRESCLRAYSRQFPEATPRQLEYFYAFASGGHMELLRKWAGGGYGHSRGGNGADGGKHHAPRDGLFAEGPWPVRLWPKYSLCFFI